MDANDRAKKKMLKPLQTYDKKSGDHSKSIIRVTKKKMRVLEVNLDENKNV